jgi:hypothetical protein
MQFRQILSIYLNEIDGDRAPGIFDKMCLVFLSEIRSGDRHGREENLSGCVIAFDDRVAGQVAAGHLRGTIA